ncbi:general substrate transporter [Athelia psychrophila]|uniref:General substrate transporter n=1 Tax=Athelia psychrophila TaxID=1759441 RepID=A0A166CJR9_9AGAM|nr:general substrate transporter [Fibularhizoctonia sp. CBS 109695]
MLALLASMGGFIFGYDTGQISDILLLPDFLKRFATCADPTDASTCAFTVVREGLIVSILSIGTLAGALAGAPTADFLGRRHAMSAECAVFIVGVVIQLSSTHVWQQYAVGRLVSGLAVGALSAVVPIYQAESVPAPIRGTLTATYQLFITFGILVAYCVSIGAREAPGSGSWRIIVGIGIAWPLILGIGILFMPESPRWLAARDRMPDAQRSIARTHGRPADHPIVRSVAEEIHSDALATRGLKSGWAECFRWENKALYRTLLGMTLQSIQQLTGANYFYYGATIFKSVGINDSFVTQIILGAVNFICTFGGLYVMEKFGRRVPLIVGGLWQSAWLFVFATAGTANDPSTSHGTGQLMTVSACMFILGYAMTWAPGVWILIGEMFPTQTRAKQGALATASNWLFNFLLAFFTPFITKAIHYQYGFIFASCNLLGAVVVYFFLYDSSNLSLEAVNLMYTDPACTPRNSTKWAPPGFSSRKDLVEQVKAGETGKPWVGGGKLVAEEEEERKEVV